MPIDRTGIESIVERVLGELEGERATTPQPKAFDGRGILPDIDAATQAAQSAFRELAEITLEERRDFISAMRATILEHIDQLSELAVQETGLGRVEDKVRKNRLAARATPGVEDLRPHAFSGDHGLTLIERAPYGIIGSITPSTNPSETIVNNAIGMVAAGNTVVFNPHPSARVVSLTTIDLLNRAIAQAGGPRALLFAPVDPSVASAQQLMAHPDIRLLVVTGGPGVVKAAMHSGKRVVAAGPGNPPVVVDSTADIEKAGRDIVAGATLDNNIVCIAEKEIVAERDIVALLKRSLAGAGAVEIKGQSLARLMDVLIAEEHGPRQPATMNRAFIGKNLEIILDAAGLSCPHGARMAFFEADEDHPLVWTEQMLPVLPLVTAQNAKSAIEMAKRFEGDCRHTAVMHSKNVEHMSIMARAMDCSIFVKNGPSYAGLGFGGEGFTTFTIASPTGEGLTSARTFTRERRCTLVDYFRIV